MKKCLLIILLLTNSFLLQAASAPPPPPSRSHGFDKNHETPLGGGMEILLVLGMVYGGKKAYDARKRGY